MYKPSIDEYSPLFQKYVELVTNENVVDALTKQIEDHVALLQNLSESEAQYRYEPNKWSIKTVIGHIADVERLSQYRLLRIARGDVRELSGYDRDIFALNSQHDECPFDKIVHDYYTVRQSTLSLIHTLTPEALVRTGQFNEHPLSARAILYTIAGHELHHINILKTRYLTNH